MDQLKRYIWPISVGGAVFLVAMIAILGWIIPEGHHVSSANVNKITLQAQETELSARIKSLKDASKNEPANCTNLRQDLQLVPETPTVDLFLHQVSQLALLSNTATPSVQITSAGTPGTGPSASGAATVGIDLSVSGSYQQVLAFLKGLSDGTLQRLFAVSSVSLSNGATGGATGGSTGSSQGFSLQLQGDIYYSTTEGNVCQTTTPNGGSSST